MSELARIVDRIRSEQNLGREVPGFDPRNGNEKARFLLVLEAPGPKAVASGVISLDNDDLSAKNLRAQLQAADISRADLAIWNVVPWYLGNDAQTKIRAATAKDIKPCLAYLSAVVNALKRLECTFLLAAQRARRTCSSRTRPGHAF